MGDLRFSEDHEYVRVEGDLAVVGITGYAIWSLLIAYKAPEEKQD